MREPGPGRLIVLAGLPGSGKTTVAAHLSSRYDGVVASRDTIRDAMFPACRYTVQEKNEAFEAMKVAIATMLRFDMLVVTDGICFSSSAQLQQVLAIADTCGAARAVLHCVCSVGLAERRVEADLRTDPTVPRDRDAAMVRQTAARFDPLPDDVLTVNSELDVEQMLAEVDRVLEPIVR